MKRILLKISFFALMLMQVAMASAQTNTISGAVSDNQTGELLAGVSVNLKGTTTGVATDAEGKFTLQTSLTGKQTLVVSFISYSTKEIPITISDGGTTELGVIQLESESIGLEGIEVIASVAVDRKTPVAVSTIKAVQIEERASNQEFPELLKSTPSVYTTKAGGGYGDSRINVRGFSSVNMAILINGIPVNDMENGVVYWSNWAGLTDVTQNMQIQRGLGAARVAVPSVGGTINVITRSTEATRGGSIFYGVGNNGYNKASFTLSTGLSESGWAMTMSAAKIEGNGYVEGTEFIGYNYFLNISKKINENHILSFTGTGAPQRHGQRQNRQSVDVFRDAPQGIRYNADWGYKNGQVVNVEDNFYHKPVFSLNHYWTINEKSELATSAYLSFGTGGGGGTGGDFAPARKGYEPMDIDALVDINQNALDGNAVSWLRASRNDHTWFGVLSTYTNQLTENIELLAGIDLRSYTGRHFTELTDLLGADYLLDNSDVNHPNRVLKVGDKYSYNNDGKVNWTGGFVQAEYAKEKLSAFANLSVSNTSYQRIDYYLYLENDPLRESDKYNFLGYQAKGGANYNLTDHHNVFANVGYFERAPMFNSVFFNNNNVNINEDAENEKIASVELGYGYRSAVFNGNVNFYNTNWADKSFSRSFTSGGEIYYANILGVDALHKGVEVDFTYQPTRRLTVTGMLSIGDWRWKNNVDSVQVRDEDQTVVGTIGRLYIADLKVGDAAQTTAALGVNYIALDGLKIGLNFNYFTKLYANYEPTSLDKPENAGVQPLELPDYGTFDLSLRYDFKLGGVGASVLGNVNNLFNEEYIAEAQGGLNSVFYGVGRTWSVGMKFTF